MPLCGINYPPVAWKTALAEHRFGILNIRVPFSLLVEPAAMPDHATATGGNFASRFVTRLFFFSGKVPTRHNPLRSGTIPVAKNQRHSQHAGHCGVAAVAGCVLSGYHAAASVMGGLGKNRITLASISRLAVENSPSWTTSTSPPSSFG